MINLIKKNRDFFNLIARYYDSIILKIWLTKIQKKTLEFINPEETAIILDAGCGTGNLLELLKGKYELYGIDISSEMLKIAKRKISKNVKLRLISAERLDYKNKFDYIFSTEAFHHFTNQDLAVKNMKRALKKKGELVIVDLDFGRALNWIFHVLEPGNSKMNSKEDFRRLFKYNKFINIKQKRMGVAILTSGTK